MQRVLRKPRKQKPEDRAVRPQGLRLLARQPNHVWMIDFTRWKRCIGTGLRRSEIRRLRWCDIDYERGVVRVPASSAKSRRDQTVALPERLAVALMRARPADAADTETVVPKGAFPNSVTFHRDVEAAGIEREDAEGRVIDMHALRTTYVSWLATTGAHPRVAQGLARHASIETTMGRYTDLSLVDTKGAVERLPLPRAPRKRGRPVSPPRTWDRRGKRTGA